MKHMLRKTAALALALCLPVALAGIALGADGGKNDAHKDASSDPSAGLDALDKLKSQISCPVDLKSLAGSM